MNTIYELYEIISPCASDLSLDEQILHGINDWQLDCLRSGHTYFGRSADEALASATANGF